MSIVERVIVTNTYEIITNNIIHFYFQNSKQQQKTLSSLAL